MDLEKFFDRVNHDVLMSRVARRVEDKRLLKLIRAFLNAGVLEDGLFSDTREGTPQGGPLSPLLSNLLLDDLDQELEARGLRFAGMLTTVTFTSKSPSGQRVLLKRDEMAGQEAQAEGQPEQECRGSSLEPQVPGVHVHDDSARSRSLRKSKGEVQETGSRTHQT